MALNIATKANPPRPVDGGSRGSDNKHHNSSGYEPTRCEPDRTANARERLLCSLLERTTSWLLSYAYGGFRDTVSARGRALADVLALAAYASCITPVPVMFAASGEDLPARRMLEAFAFLVPRCDVRVSASPRPVVRLNAGSGDIDAKTGAMAETPLLPSLALSDRGTAATLRRDLLADAGERGPRILSNGRGPGSVVRSVARVAGGRWENVAGMLFDPERLPSPSVAPDGEAARV